MTNHNYLLEFEGKKYVARFAPPTSKILGLSRHREIYNYRSASKLDIGAKVVASYPKYNLLVVEYLAGKIMTPKIVRRPEMIKSLAKMLRTLHTKGNLKGSWDAITRARHYIHVAEKQRGWTPKNFSLIKKEFEQVCRAVQPFSKTDPCHTDLMLENIIITPQGNIKLLDWEYSSNADYRYDLAMLSVKGDFTEKEDELLASSYGKGGKNYLKTRNATKALVYFAEASYGILQDAISKKKVNYRRYAEENIREFKKLVNI